MSSPAVTVVIATRNRRDELLTTLDHLSRMPDRPDVVVVDNGSTDGTPAAVRNQFPATGLIALAGNFGAAARNAGVSAATTPLIAFSDDDSWWDPGALTTAEACFEADPQLGLIAGRILVGPDGDLDPVCSLMQAGRWDEHLRPSPHGRRGVTGFLACGAVVRRRAFVGVGGFERHLVIGAEEETVAVDLASAGWKLVYEPGVVARHHPSTSRQIRLRQVLQSRNEILTAFSRYPLRLVARQRLLPSRGEARVGASALVQALRSAGWALSRRRPAQVSTARCFLES